jgi:hypothetical protein
MALHLKTIEQVQSEQTDEEIDIKFVYCKGIDEDYEIAPKPQRMTHFFPDKMKGHELNVPPEEVDSKELTGYSVKSCMPFTDCMKLGFGIPLWHYLFVRNGTAYDTRLNQGMSSDDPYRLTSHDKGQLDNTTIDTLKLPSTVLKLVNPWRVITPEGWSCLFTAPYHRDDIPIKIMSGVVDTDRYYTSVQFPFTVDKDFAGEVPIGTVVAQVIPFKRVNSKMAMSYMNEKEEKELNMGRGKLLRKSKSHYLEHYRDKRR